MDRKGVEPFTRGLQDDAVHRHSAHGLFALGAEDSNLHELVQSQPCCLVASAPIGGPAHPSYRPDRRAATENRTRTFAVAGRGTAVVLQPLVRSRVLRRPCGIRTRGLQVEGLARSPLLQRSISLIVRGPRVERGGSCSQGRWVDRLPHPGCVPSLEINGTLLLSTVEFSMFGCDRSRRRGGRTRTHYLRCWRPACKDRVHLTPMRSCRA